MISVDRNDCQETINLLFVLPRLYFNILKTEKIILRQKIFDMHVIPAQEVKKKETRNTRKTRVSNGHTGDGGGVLLSRERSSRARESGHRERLFSARWKTAAPIEMKQLENYHT